MSASHYPLEPTQWEPGTRESRELARLLGAAWRRRWQLSAWYPWVPAPPARVNSQFHGTFGPYPAGALVRLWTHCSFFVGRCPSCGGDGLGFCFTGNLSQGHIAGICRGCAAWLRRYVDGIGGYMAAVRPALQDSPFSVNGGPPGGSGAPVALVAVLGELGECGLPDPRGSALRPNSPRNAEGR
jgi:hypothetical protein